MLDIPPGYAAVCLLCTHCGGTLLTALPILQDPYFLQACIQFCLVFPRSKKNFILKLSYFLIILVCNANVIVLLIYLTGGGCIQWTRKRNPNGKAWAMSSNYQRKVLQREHAQSPDMEWKRADSSFSYSTSPWLDSGEDSWEFPSHSSHCKGK